MIEIADLTYFNGRPFVRLEESAEEGWAIVLDGDAWIINKDPNIALPDEDKLLGTVLLRVVFSELDTRLQFGVLDSVAEEVVLNPLLYTITDPVYTPEGEIYPQVLINPEDEIPPDPSAERAVDGPENEEGDS